ncbi:MAG: hypothetical protein QOD06_1426 [Candidatus Binatota bacterium]|jgi:SAM-dependent methyltransferase|nr:hypothetical protein [Candidatus Binatota bacterium]
MPRLFAALPFAILILSGSASAGERRLFEATSHRRFDDVGRWKPIFEDPKRDEWQKPAEVVRALGLEPGTRVADLGAGTGYFMPYLSRAVGPSGTVFEVDVEPNLVVHLRERAEKEKAGNVTPVLASLDDARLPVGAVDMILIVDTYHHLDDRRAYLARLKRSLSSRGRIAVVDWEAGDIPVGPEPEHKLPREQVIEEMRLVGYALTGEPKVIPYQYVLLFRPR